MLLTAKKSLQDLFMYPRLLLFIGVMFLSSLVRGQINMVYNIGVIGNFDTSSNFSGPIYFDPDKCIQIHNNSVVSVSTHIDSTQFTGQSLFSINCLQLISKAEISFIGFPNPANAFVIIKTQLNTQFLESGPFFISVYDITGRRVANFQTDLNTLNFGFKINTSSFASGMYGIQIFSNSTNAQVLKIFKVTNQ